MKAVYTIKDIIKRLKQDEMTSYFERFQFNNEPIWNDWLSSSSIYHYTYLSDNDDREFDDSISITGIPMDIVQLLSEIDSLKFINSLPSTSDSLRMSNEETIYDIDNKVWGLSYRYGSEGYGKDNVYIFWVWNNGYFVGIFKGKISDIRAK